MKHLFSLLLLITFARTALAQSQGLDFAGTPYFTAAGPALTASGQTLSAFDFSSAPASHPLLTDGIYFPVVDYQQHNLWVRVRHVAADPNGTAVGHHVPTTAGSPFRSDGFGGWAGFLYQFDIYQDANPTGPPANTLNGLYPTNITVESIETLSQPEWVSFELQNPQASSWSLNSINFTGLNPNSTPGFSSVNIPWTGGSPPTGFSTTFPAGSRSIYVVDYGSSSYAEFRMSADQVSQFRYGYEYNSTGGYQGMRLYFGIRSATGTGPEQDRGHLSALPTRTDDVVDLAFSLAQSGPAELWLTDTGGRRVLLQRETYPAGACRQRLSLAGQPVGLYLLSLQTASGRLTTKILKTR